MQKDLDELKQEKVDAAVVGLELTEREQRFVDWMVDWELETVESFNSIMRKAKQSGKEEV